MEGEASIVNFNESFLGWKIHGKISGRANAECLITRINLESGEREEFILANGVLACHVLNNSKLIMEPYYLFQTCMSEKKFKSFRTGTSLTIQNDHGLTESRYDSVKPHISRMKGKKLTNPEAVNAAVLEHKSISVSFEVRTILDSYLIEFPGKHIYYRADLRQFQIEAGPVLLPTEFNRMDLPAGWCTCYVAFNTFDRLEYAMTRNATLDGVQYADYGPTQELKTEIDVCSSL